MLNTFANKVNVGVKRFVAIEKNDFVQIIAILYITVVKLAIGLIDFIMALSLIL